MEATKHALRLRAAKTEAVFFMLAQLPLLNVYDHEYFISELLVIFLSVDVTLTSKVTDWLAGAYGLAEAQRVVSHSLSTWSSMPLAFERTSSYGYIVGCRCGAAKEPEDNVDSDDDQDAYGKSKKKPHGEGVRKFIECVSATTESQPFIAGTILATIREGDLVRLKSHSRLWWTVFEMRPARGTVLLCNKESRVSGPQTINKREIKTEYKEVRLYTLLGCLVRREGVLSSRTMEQWGRAPGRELEFQDRLICCPKDAEKEGFVGASADAYTGEGSRRVSIIFQIPGHDLRASIGRIKQLVAEFPRVIDDDLKKSHMKPSKLPEPPVDPIKHMQYQAQAKVWVSRWEEVQRARQLLLKMDPFSCVLSREQWLLAARALKVISRGGSELLQDFIDLTQGAGREGQLRARDCRVAWECLRPVTSADLPVLSKARAYLKMRGAGKDQACFDENGRLRPDAMNVDPLSRGILEAASTYLSERSMVFLDQSLGAASKVAAIATAALEDAALPVAAAIYDHFLPTDLAGEESSEVRTVYQGVETVKACISPGDVLLVRGSLGAEAQAQAGSGANRNRTWVQVISVDLLFARLRVVPCSCPPPACWYEPSMRPELLSHAGSINTPACWLPLSRVWDVTVCRLLPMTDPADASAQRGRHLIFVSPMPSPAEALAVLGGFERKPLTDQQQQQQQQQQHPDGSKRSPVRSSKQAVRRSQEQEVLSTGVRTSSSQENRRLSIAALSFYTDAVIVAWTAIKLVPQPFVNVKGVLVTPTASDCQVSYELDIAHVSRPYEWLRVYSGQGLGAQVSGLEHLQQYYCRITASAALPQTLEYRRGGRPDEVEKAQELERRRAQTVVNTLGLATSSAPSVSTWEPSASGSARGLVTVFSKETFFVPDLASECFFQIEASLGPSVVSSRDDDEQENWIVVGRTRTAQCYCVGPFAGRSILLRSRVVNQIGQPGPPSPVACIVVPDLERKPSSKNRGLNDSGISELTNR